ncbi:transcription/translation regulatory transformer protein RfaH [Marinobacter sp. CHS3-4]|uniref:transcription/translation regulatory transformer protein RfaH n=1 Tax=Marinobacter sp. CHS3-4 TaxID=3045174 RepID=UPI0024B53955|nr:transcription/translation regulatory transformer protein RfaH [Marinobacter sp. CHS3-4]MDI9244969.1 transcription/translation regulatory transformer protein RfaH [Marinobacter sp. CHS3-4]
MIWYAIQHKPAQGNRALENLQNQGVTCFYPKVTVEKIRAGKRIKKHEALFPGYLFINLDNADPIWSKLRSTRGVIRVVSFANKPAVIDDQTIQLIKSGLEQVESKGGIKPGQSIEIASGPFAGLSAIFQAYDGEERAIVLISFMQKQQAVRVPLSSIQDQC